MNIGKTIKEIRKRKGLSQQALAKLTGISQTYISQLENNVEHNPSIEILNKISKSLEIPYPILAFLTLDNSDIIKDKQEAFKKIRPAVNGLIKEFFLSEDVIP